MTDAISRSAVLEILENEFNMAAEEREDAEDEKDRAFNAGEINCARRSTRKVTELPDIKIDGNTSDGYHTFNELYDHRAKLFSVIVRDHSELCWKSKLHHDGTMYDGMFIVGINTPHGQASYHYDIDPYWDMFKCKEMERAPEWDGHTPEEAINRIAAIDAVPVVRCADCKHRCTFVCPMYHTETCLDDLDGFDDYDVDRTYDDGFCHLGERWECEEDAAD